LQYEFAIPAKRYVDWLKAVYLLESRSEHKILTLGGFILFATTSAITMPSWLKDNWSIPNRADISPSVRTEPQLDRAIVDVL
jgi:hypothetical protein